MAKQSYEKAKPAPVENAATPPLVESMERGFLIMKAENDALAAMAARRPRDEEKVLERAVRELELAPEYAEEAFYVRPVGKDHNGVPKYAEDVSYAGACGLQRIWGNSSSSARMVEKTDNEARVEGVFVDFESGARYSREQVISRFYRKKGSRDMDRMDDERFAMAIGATGSKVMRNVILAGMPNYVKRAFFDAAKRIVAQQDGKKGGDIKGRIAKMIASFKTLGASDEMLSKFIGKSVWEASPDDLVQLRGVFNAIKDGEATVQGTFTDENAAGPVETEPAVTPETVLKGGKVVS